jgi:hypothetical protein
MLCSLKTSKGRTSRPATAEMLKTIKQKTDKSLHDFVKHFCNSRNVILHIQDIKIINTFHDSVTDLKTVEEIAIKKVKTMANLLIVIDECIKALEA